jgi:hypothetical protein
MSEHHGESSESRLSSEQEGLIATARQLLELPKAVQNGPYYSGRRTTSKEKAQWLLGKISGSNRQSLTYYDGYFERPQTETITKTIGLKGLGGWGDGLYLKQTTTKDLDIGMTTENLTMYTMERRNDRPATTDYGAWYEEITWSQELLQPIDNADEVARLQTELDEAFERLHS